MIWISYYTFITLMFITFIYLYTLTFYKYITLGSGLQKKKKNSGLQEFCPSIQMHPRKDSITCSQ